MNRQIIFRGKRIDNGEWIYGSFLNIEDTCFIIEKGDFDFDYRTENYAFWFDCTEKEVNPDTIGQFTGLTDKNGKEIYEGDIIHLDCHAWLDWKELDSVKAEIVYDNGTFGARWKNPDAGKPYPFQNPDDEEDVEAEYVCEFIGNLPKTIEVIGSIHDNPDLLNGK